MNSLKSRYPLPSVSSVLNQLIMTSQSSNIFQQTALSGYNSRSSQPLPLVLVDVGEMVKQDIWTWLPIIITVTVLNTWSQKWTLVGEGFIEFILFVKLWTIPTNIRVSFSNSLFKVKINETFPGQSWWKEGSKLMRRWSISQYQLIPTSDLAPEHPSPGIVRLEDHIEPVKLQLSEVRVMQQPPFIFSLKDQAGCSLTTTEDCNK